VPKSRIASREARLRTHSDMIGESNNFRVLGDIEYSRSCQTMVASFDENSTMRRVG
jgi:hypothetical protein